jgi:hypothetical protein
MMAENDKPLKTNELLELMEIIEEQQVLIGLLLKLYPESPEKAEILAGSRRIVERTRKVKSYLVFAARSEEKGR